MQLEGLRADSAQRVKCANRIGTNIRKSLNHDRCSVEEVTAALVDQLPALIGPARLMKFVDHAYAKARDAGVKPHLADPATVPSGDRMAAGGEKAAPPADPRANDPKA